MREIVSPLSGFRSPFGSLTSPLAIYAAAGIEPVTVFDFVAGAYFVDSQNTGIDGLTFSRASSAMMRNSSGEWVSVGINEPRIGHYEWDGSAWVKKGLLKEGQATNFDSTSNEFTGAGATVVTPNAGTSPAGDETAVLVSEATASTSNACLFGAASTGVVGAPICNAVRVKYVSGSGWVALIHRSSSLSHQFFAWFNVLTGAKGSAEAGSGGMTYVDHGIFYEGNGWYVVYTVGSDSVSGDFNGFVASASADLDKGREAGSSYLVWQHQLTEGTQPSSPIPTNGSAATRAADVMTQPAGTLPWPTPEVIGPELVVNGGFDADSDWVGTGGNWVITGGQLVASGPAFGQITQGISFTEGSVYLTSFEVVSRTSGSVKLEVAGTQGTARNAPGVYTEVLVAGSGTPSFAIDNVGGFAGVVDNVSVREINPLALTIGMAGEVSWSAYNPNLFRWYGGYYNQIQVDLNYNYDRLKISHGADGSLTSLYSDVNSVQEGLNVPFTFCTTHASTFVAAAVNGVALTTNTTPTALPDLIATEVEILSTFNGTISRLVYWDKDVTDDGRLEASA